LIPSLFDLVCTIFGMCGLMFVNVSIYQMMRGAAIVFVALLKEFFLGDKLKKYHWVGIFWNFVSIVLVGATAVLAPAASASTSSNSILGISLILLAALMGSLQYAFEEKVLNMEIAAPPLFVIGVEGLWGTLICIFVLYPIAYLTPGSDDGSFENPFNTWYMLSNNQELQLVMFFYFVSIFFYNLFGILVTFLLHSVWRGILDNFRPITVWIVDLSIYYFLTTSFGESWTPYSWLQLVGLAVLLYGTAIYNAPNPGSIFLIGGPSNCFIDFSDEYAPTSESIEITEVGESSIGKVDNLAVLPSPFIHRDIAFSPKSPMKRHSTMVKTTAVNTYGGIEAGESLIAKPMKKTASLGF